MTTIIQIDPSEVTQGGLLRLYFEAAARMGDKSPFGGMMDRAEGYSYEHARRTCRGCDGEGVDLKYERQWFEARDKYNQQMALLFDDWKPFEEVKPYNPRKCPRCGGEGETRGRTKPTDITVAITAETRGAPECRDPSWQAQQAARATRIMHRVGRSSRLHQATLQAYFGERGEYCSGTVGIANRLIAIIPLTKMGHRWRLKHVKRRSWQEVSRKLGELAHGKPEERAQFLLMADTAQRLIRAACQTWGECCE